MSGSIVPQSKDMRLGVKVILNSEIYINIICTCLSLGVDQQ